jgi:arabinogalactan oligomer / maltooligosaccharide transport system permease protein
MKKWLSDNLWRHAVAISVSFFALFPLYLVVISSFNPTGSLKITSFIPDEFSLVNYKKLFNDPTIPYLVWMKNTVIISSAVAVLSVVIGASAAFAFSRLKFKGKRTGIQFLFLVQMFPAILALSAVYVIMERVYKFAPAFGLGTQPGLLLVYLGGAMGVNIWLLKGFVDSIPIELDEAAKVDGATPMQTYWQIFIPLAAPILAVVSLLSFIGTFNEFILARLFLVDMNSRTVAVGLQGFIGGQYADNWGAFAAGSIIASVPIVIIFLSLQKYIISGLTAGSVKG